ncbi:uncharacterized protein PHALS_10674 [Plasmopara halstedii]|uniref:Uncharacterized protein n=1 Tax=Plasmopara halstedii TaxID=4781 RepID=A0A0P1AIU0_PLAHL|nr:uncharacterized protein PHALS_10674 [Plasmopara halstedii]CEG40477.1 hypothetical protein PHALS_10674 [Plasmopara halstedii]|eukprot:XP_024576846.1 hypothetical protein PHALS_10674 [Plasmopara halstedii]
MPHQVIKYLNAAPNPGKVWEQWKRIAIASLDQAATRYRIERDIISKDASHAALNTYRDCVSQAHCFNKDPAFDFQVQNTETSSSVHSTHHSDSKFPRPLGCIMGADSSTEPPPIVNPDSQRELLNTIDKRLT